MSPHDRSSDFEAWQAQLLKDPSGTDLRGVALLLVVLTTTLVAGCCGLFFFPPVALPRIVLAIPGLVGGGLVYLGLRKVYFRVTPGLTLPISLAMMAGGAVVLAWFFNNAL